MQPWDCKWQKPISAKPVCVKFLKHSEWNRGLLKLVVTVVKQLL